MPAAEWLKTTVVAVREMMLKRLEAESLDGEGRREMEMALEELDVMWEELQGQAVLLTRENERYAEFFEFAPNAYLISDTGGNVREANRAACELLGARREELVGRPLGLRVPEGERAAFLGRWVGVALDGGTSGATWRGTLLAAGGSRVEVQFSVRGIPLKKSGVGGLCWLIRTPA